MKKHTLMVKGYGGALLVAGMSQKAYQYFLSKNIDFEEYAFNCDIRPKPRVRSWPFPPGGRYEGDFIFEGRGAFAADGGIIEVHDAQMRRIWRCPINLERLREAGVHINTFDVVARARREYAAGYYVLDYIKGLHCVDNFLSKNNFDPGKLHLDFLSFMNMEILLEVRYGKRFLDDSEGKVKCTGTCAALVRFD